MGTIRIPIDSAVHSVVPDADCRFCPRLAAFRDENRSREPSWFNAPVPTFAAPGSRLLIVGLAPGLRGANRTGRPFTGDYAGDLLYATLLAHGFAQGSYDSRPDDGLRLSGCTITNAVRCVPPANKPMPLEIATCRPFLQAAIEAASDLRAIVVLGRIAHDSVVRAFGRRLAEAPFGHGRRHDLISNPSRRSIAVFDSYHCSRYNTNTGVLTAEMFDQVFAAVAAYLVGAPA